MTPPEHAQRIVDFLNELVAIDREAIEQLIEFRVPCNQALADHTTVQVESQGYGPRVGLLGLLNGLVGVNAAGWGYIMADFDGNAQNIGHLIGFRLNRIG
jgi:hypothetical protein